MAIEKNLERIEDEEDIFGDKLITLITFQEEFKIPTRLVVNENIGTKIIHELFQAKKWWINYIMVYNSDYVYFNNK